MTDIVERLHKHADVFEGDEGDLMREAADEIELLRKAHISALQAVSDAAAAEREACAKIVDPPKNEFVMFEVEIAKEVRKMFAAAIRSRGGGHD